MLASIWRNNCDLITITMQLETCMAGADTDFKLIVEKETTVNDNRARFEAKNLSRQPGTPTKTAGE